MQSFGPIGDHEHADIESQAALHELAEEAGTDFPIFCRRLHKAEEPFSPVIVTPTAATISSSANVLPSSSRATRHSGVAAGREVQELGGNVLSVPSKNSRATLHEPILRALG